VFTTAVPGPYPEPENPA